jgi:excisionase family DNA binding protein
VERLLTPKEVGELLGVPVRTLYRWRYLGTGPRAIRIGKQLRYRLAQIEEYVDLCCDLEDQPRTQVPGTNDRI